jgi:hypothetical protein
MTPSALSTTPLPSALPCAVATVIETTLGCTEAATFASDSVGVVAASLVLLEDPSDDPSELAVVEGWSMRLAMTAPAVPLPTATRASTPAAAVPRIQRLGSP